MGMKDGGEYSTGDKLSEVWCGVVISLAGTKDRKVMGMEMRDELKVVCMEDGEIEMMLGAFLHQWDPCQSQLLFMF